MVGIDAIVLAGSVNNGRLRECSEEAYEAMVKIGQRPMISYVVEALQKSSMINRIVIAGPFHEMTTLFKNKDRVMFAPGGKTPVETLLQALEVLGPAGKVLVATSDIPLLSTDSVADFIKQCSKHEADFYYPIVSKEINEARFPGVKRTYVKLKEGTFTGGNLFLIDAQIAKPCAAKAEEIVRMRKSPFDLARLVGWRFLFKFLLKILTLKEAEVTVSRMLEIKGRVIISEFPEVGIDVDKPSDLMVVREKILNA